MTTVHTYDSVTLFMGGKPMPLKRVSFSDEQPALEEPLRLGTFSVTGTFEWNITRRGKLRFDCITSGVKPHRKARVMKRRIKRAGRERYRAYLATLTTEQARIIRAIKRRVRWREATPKRSIVLPLTLKPKESHV